MHIIWVHPDADEDKQDTGNVWKFEDREKDPAPPVDVPWSVRLDMHVSIHCHALDRHAWETVPQTMIRAECSWAALLISVTGVGGVGCCCNELVWIIGYMNKMNRNYRWFSTVTLPSPQRPSPHLRFTGKRHIAKYLRYKIKLLVRLQSL